MPFASPVPVYGLNRSLGAEQRFGVSSDELTVYLGIGYSELWSDIYVATRSNTMQAFGIPVPIVSVNTEAADMRASVTRDGLSLFFDSNRTGIAKVYAVTRSTTDGQFDSLRQVLLYGHSQAFDPYVLPDGSALYFGSDTPEYGLYRAAMSGANVEPSVMVIGGGARFPVVSEDERTIYYSANLSEDLEIVMATRPSRDVAFGEPTILTRVNAAGALDEPQGISPDGCRLYMTRRFLPEISISLVAERIRN